jgi:hypothetical protein
MKLVTLVLATMLLASCAGALPGSGQSLDAELNSIVRPYVFSIAQWEMTTLLGEAGQTLSGREDSDTETQVVKEYFGYNGEIGTLESEIAGAEARNEMDRVDSLEAELERLKEPKAVLENAVEQILEKQIRAVLAEQGIYNPVINLTVSFPPVDFQLQSSPDLLVVSPRDKIEPLREITLQPILDVKEMEDIESQADKLGVSSLVVGTGGVATYPSMVANNADLRFTLDTAAEEWVHQYLAFTPLGFRYVLDEAGLVKNYDIATMNETVAGMVAKEIGALVYAKYYPGFDSGTKVEAPGPVFDFNVEMREIRKTVDALLAQGKVEQAENFMEQKRQYLASKGYYIRKLNQAYFAWYGTYADSPTSISPIGAQMGQLRTESTSLKDFLRTAAALTGPEQLEKVVSEKS